MTKVTTQQDRSSNNGPKSKTRYKKLIVIAGIVIVITAGLVVFVVLNSRPVLDQTVVDKADFPVYSPKQLPAGYTIDSEKTNLGDDTLSYVLSQELSEGDITVTVQPVPKGFSMRQMIDKGSVQSTQVSSGTLYNLSTGGSTQYMLETGDSLVFITSQVSIDTATINSLADSFAKQN